MRSYDFMNAEEVAQYLHLGKNTVYQLAKSGKLASYHVGRKLKFTLEDVEAYLNASRQALKRDSAIEKDEDAETAREESLVEAASFGVSAETPFVIAGADQGADIIASALNASGATASRKLCASYTALVNLYAGEADAAVTNLYDQTQNNWNVPFVRSLAPGVSVVVLRLYGRRQGLIVQEGNPKNLKTWGSLLREGVRLANRKRGSGSRVLLDEKLRALEAQADSVEGYSAGEFGGRDAMHRVASGIADVTIGSEREAQHVPGVQFVPLASSWVDVTVRKDRKNRSLIRQIKEILGYESLQRDFSNLAPCDASKLGVIIYES